MNREADYQYSFAVGLLYFKKNFEGCLRLTGPMLMS